MSLSPDFVRSCILFFPRTRWCEIHVLNSWAFPARFNRVSSTLAFVLLDLVVVVLVRLPGVTTWTLALSRAVYLSCGSTAPVCCCGELCLLGSAFDIAVAVSLGDCVWLVHVIGLVTPSIRCDRALLYSRFRLFVKSSVTLDLCVISELQLKYTWGTGNRLSMRL